MPAPMAPPARARPPPTNAPAVWTAVSLTAIEMPLLVYAESSAQLVTSGAPDRLRSVREFGGVVGVGLVLLWLTVAGGRHAEVQHGQQREDEPLDAAHEHLQQLPDQARDPRRVERDQADHRQHDAAGEAVAEESQGQGDRLGQLLEDVQREQHREGLDEVPEVALGTLLADAVDPHADHRHDRHRVRQVGVRGGRRQQVQVVVDLGRQQLEPVGDQDEEEQRDRQRHHERVQVAEIVLDLLVDLADDRLPQELDLGGDVARVLLGQRRARPEAEDQHDGTGDEGRDDRVDVERDATDGDLGVLTDLDVGGGEGQQEAGHGFFNSLSSGIVVITRAMRRKMARPSSSPMPSGQKATAIPTATTVRTSSRTKVADASLPRVTSSPDRMVLSSHSSVARWLARPSVTPVAMHPARVQRSSWPAIQYDATTRTTATPMVLRWSRSTCSSAEPRPTVDSVVVVGEVVIGVLASGIVVVSRSVIGGCHPRSAARTRSQKPMPPTTIPAAMPARVNAGDVPTASSRSRPMTMPATTAPARRPPSPTRSRPRSVLSEFSSTIHPSRFHRQA